MPAGKPSMPIADQCKLYQLEQSFAKPNKTSDVVAVSDSLSKRPIRKLESDQNSQFS